MGGKRFVLETPIQANYDPKFDCYRFPKIQFTSDLLDEGPTISKTLIIAIKE